MKFLVPLLLAFVACTYASPTGIGSRIIGGEDATAGQFPFAAAITYTTIDGRYFCGGTLLSQKHILTAGHCVNGATEFSIILGSGKRDGSDASAVRASTGLSTLHDDFIPYPPQYDLGIIELHLPLFYTDYIRPIELPTIGLQDYAVVLAIGWGELSDSDPAFAEYLQRVEVSVLSNEECKRIYGDAIIDSVACIKGNDNEGTCRGDNGGPLVQYRNGRTAVVVGVSSFIAEACEGPNPSGFTRVFDFLDWITTTAQL